MKIFWKYITLLILLVVLGCDDELYYNGLPLTSKMETPQYVDLGLSVNWGTCNVGATKPEEYGSYFAWGETTAKSSYKSSNYGYSSDPVILPLDRDAARVILGGNWRMPTATEIDELLNNCTWTWTTQNGVNGYKVTSKKSGYTDKSIFLPAASTICYDVLRNTGSYGDYWSSSLYGDGDGFACHLFFSSRTFGQSVAERCYGQPVRPVCPSGSYVSVTGVKLNTTSVSLEVGDTTTLTATVSPSNATDKSVTWKSSNTTVATVDSYGKVTAKSAGTATITVTTTDGNKTATCTVTVKSKSADGKENGHDYVDLGLPSGLKWATCNVGASKPEDYGEYFAWGETTAKSSYDWENLKYRTSGDSYENVKFSKYVSDSRYGTADNKTVLELSDDAARANWGGSWRMPTATEIDELLNNCTWTWTTLNGVNGYNVTSKKTGYTDKFIFLPAAGCRYNGSLGNAGSFGIYWSSSLSTSYSNGAYELYFYSDYHGRNSDGRSFGLSVRPVCPSESYVFVTEVKLNTTSLSLEVGGTSTLTATVSPSDATDKSVTWESNNTSVAIVDSIGKITAKSAGTATITVTTTDGNFTATCTVTVTSQQVSVTGVKLNTTSVSLEVGDTTTLTATVSPSNATDKSVTWESNNTSVAIVDSIGKITAKSDGTAVITVTTTDGNFTATCTVTVTSPQSSSDGSENGHDYVDLGLPSGVKWATCNIGASKPEEYGSYFAWGETTTKSSYHWSSLTYCLDNNGNNFSKYVSSSSYGTVDNKTTLELSDDAARANWGGSWRMPTDAEFGELIKNCTWTWTTQNGIKGYKVTSKKSGYTDKSIFLPAAGDRYSDRLISAGSGGHYWSSSLYTTSSYSAYELYFNSDNHYRYDGLRYYGRSVRPVCPSGSYVSVTGVKLNTTSVSLVVGGTTTLTATISPSNATDKSVTWKSSNTTVATVDTNGKVTAKSAGTATITVTTTDGNKTATCTVTVKSQQSSDGKENGYDYVDLGLPSGLKWATCNVGATKPEEYGDYFAWGETTSKSTYNWSTYKYCNGSSTTMTKYCTKSTYVAVDYRTTLELSDDAARANWGGSWRMPTATEIDELLDNCTWTWTTLNGVKGYRVTGTKAGYTDRGVFLPAAGFRIDGNLNAAGSYGYYWSSSLDMSDRSAYVLYFISDGRSRSSSDRCYGQSVRPVCP